MVQDVDELYQPQNKKTQINIPTRLRCLAIELREAALAMIDQAQDGEWLLHAYELRGVVDMCQQWSKHLKKEKK